MFLEAIGNLAKSILGDSSYKAIGDMWSGIKRTIGQTGYRVGRGLLNKYLGQYK